MRRLIDANALKKNHTYLWDEALGTCECVLVEDIENAPTVEAEEVVHGRWLKIAHYPYYCSVCDEPAPLGFDGEHYKSNYCPNCGADMRERKDDA